MAEAKRAKLSLVLRATCTAPVNIAVIKYWGKRDTRLILPVNDSLSGTLSQDELHAKTTVAVSEGFTQDEIWLNGRKESISNPRLQNVIAAFRSRAKDVNPDHVALKGHLRIVSKNNFPTAAGLASSAAGYACLVASLAELFGLQDMELTAIARVGSGSACRSLMGGFVRWSKGSRDDGADSLASQVAPEYHWPEMEVLILVVNAGKKEVSSTQGMQTTVETSELMQERADKIVPARMKAIEAAIQRKDFDTFAKITMQDSNQFHATCLDTYPPIFYMNDISKSIVMCLTAFNAEKSNLRAAYTYDAGPNCVIYALKQNIPDILKLVATYFPSTKSDFIRGRTTAIPTTDYKVESYNADPIQDGINYVIHTGIGSGPRVVTTEEGHLIGQDGEPRI